VEWLLRQPCCMCNGVATDPHHITGAGMAMREHDHRAIPLCRECHTSFHAFSGPFKGWSRRYQRGWQAAMVRLHRSLYAGFQVVSGRVEIEGL